VVTSAQLQALGLSRQAIADWVRRARLVRLHHGVYLVGRHRPRIEARLAGAVLAGGEASLLAGRSALGLWGVLPLDYHAPVDIVCPRGRRGRPGITVHRCNNLLPDDRCALERIPLTSPARSLLDYAKTSSAPALQAALDELRAARLLPAHELDDLRPRTRGHHGWRVLGRVLEGEREPGFSRSEGERRMLAIVRAAGLPEPRRNLHSHDYEIDQLWPEHRVAVEIDGFATHGRRRDFERDRGKGADLQAHGVTVLRFTWRQITERRLWVAARLAATLALAERPRR
jgi:very-short-patch-repair endonuclease